MPDPGPIEKEVVRDRWQRAVAGDLTPSTELLARNLHALTLRFDKLEAALTTSTDDFDNRLATAERGADLAVKAAANLRVERGK